MDMYNNNINILTTINYNAIAIASDDMDNKDGEQTTKQKKTKTKKIVWRRFHDEMLLSSVLHDEPYQYRARTRDSGKVWAAIASKLSENSQFGMIVDARGVRERFHLLHSTRRFGNAMEEKASGIDPDADNVDNLMEDIMERMAEFDTVFLTKDATEEEQAKGKRKIAEDIRLQACETFGATKKRKVEAPEDELDTSTDSATSSTSSAKRSRTNGNAALAFLSESSARKVEQHQEELKFKKEQLDFEKEKEKGRVEKQRMAEENAREDRRRQENFYTQLLEQQRQQQQQNQQSQQQQQQVMMMMMQTMQRMFQSK